MSKRISKKPEERKNELITIAEELFLKQGYESTAVSDIVKKAKVAQGTFYYYFKSKEEILDEIIEKYIQFTVKGMEKIANDKQKNALEKLIQIFFFSTSFRDDKKGLMQYLHEDRNAHLHLKFERKIPPLTIPPLSRIISQGVKEGIFTTKYPEEAARAFIGISALVLQGIDSIDKSSEEFIRKLHATFDFLERIFGTKPGLIVHAYKKQMKKLMS